MPSSHDDRSGHAGVNRAMVPIGPGSRERPIDGDTAVARTICHNPMIISTPEGNRTVYCGLWYNDRFVRTPDGWRINERVEEKCYLPPELGG